MKEYIVVFLFLAAFTCCAIGSPTDVSTRVYEANILAMLEDVRLRMCYSDPEGLPQLEPFDLADQLDFDMDSDLGKITGYIRNIHVEGLSDFIVDHLAMSLAFVFSFTIRVPKLVITGEYALRGSVGGFLEVDGENKFSVTIEDLTVRVNGRLQYQEGMYLRDLKIGLTIPALQVDIKGLTGDQEVNDFINDALTALVPEIVDELPEDFLHDLEVTIEDLVSNYLKDFTITELIQLLQGNGNLLPPLDEEKACKKNKIF